MSALREKLVERSVPFVGDEPIRHVFMAQTGMSPYMGLLLYVFLFMAKMYVIAVTDDEIVVLKAGVWRPSFPKEVYKRLPRDQKLGPLTGLWGKMELDGETYYVHKRFHKDVEAIDTTTAA